MACKAILKLVRCVVAEVFRYPTEDATVNDLCKFMYDRFPTLLGQPIRAFNDKPCLHEDWWVEEKINDGYVIPGANDNEQALRNIYRWGRKNAIDKRDWFFIDGHKELLLHQVTELIPTLFMEAKKVSERRN